MGGWVTGEFETLNAFSIAILIFVTVQRIAELVLARRNTRRLIAQGAFEAAPQHYPAIVAVHAGWLVALWLFAPNKQPDIPLLIVFALLQAGRVWVIMTLGERWTTRILILPGAPLIRSGPYRFFSHPNYLIVTAEILVLPLVFGLIGIALVFSALNALALWVRIQAENAALRQVQEHTQ